MKPLLHIQPRDIPAMVTCHRRKELCEQMAPTSAVSESCNFPPSSPVLLKKILKEFRVILESVAEKTVVPDGQPGERLLHELRCSSVIQLPLWTDWTLLIDHKCKCKKVKYYNSFPPKTNIFFLPTLACDMFQKHKHVLKNYNLSNCTATAVELLLQKVACVCVCGSFAGWQFGRDWIFGAGFSSRC